MNSYLSKLRFLHRTTLRKVEKYLEELQKLQELWELWNKNYGNCGKWEHFSKKLDESRKISIGTLGDIGTMGAMGIIGTMENGLLLEL